MVLFPAQPHPAKPAPAAPIPAVQASAAGSRPAIQAVKPPHRVVRRTTKARIVDMPKNLARHRLTGHNI